MKLESISIGSIVWFASTERWHQCPRSMPMKCRVAGIEDYGQDKYVTLQPVGTDSSSPRFRFKVKGTQDRNNGWGYNADFAFAPTRDEWYELAIEELRRRQSLDQGLDFGSRFPLYRNEVLKV